tara:strand:- start:293 stop:511 length:219 start_codon:yes stop_codon:yes gene_type:complete
VRQRARRIKEIQVYFASARAMPLRAGLVVLNFQLATVALVPEATWKYRPELLSEATAAPCACARALALRAEV